jgi:hypothetical protein
MGRTGRPQIEQERAALEIGERHLLAVGRIERGGDGRPRLLAGRIATARFVLIQCEPHLRSVTRPIVEAMIQKLGEIPG